MREKADFKREMNRNYMILCPIENLRNPYAARMLSENRIDGLLAFQEKYMDGRRKYYYDITSHQPLKRLLEHQAANGSEILRLISDLVSALRQLERFFLDADQLCLEPDMIYVEPDSFQCVFCLIPETSGNFEEDFRKLAQYLLDHADHDDETAVMTAFCVFKESRKENFGIEDMERCLYKYRNGRRESSSEAKINALNSQGSLNARGNPELRENQDIRGNLNFQENQNFKETLDFRGDLNLQEVPSFQENQDLQKNKKGKAVWRNYWQGKWGLFAAALAGIAAVLAAFLIWNASNGFLWEAGRIFGSIIRGRPWILGVLLLPAAGALFWKYEKAEKPMEPEAKNKREESNVSGEEDWEILFREAGDDATEGTKGEGKPPLEGSAKEEAEMQTVLLTCVSAEKKSRQLVPLAGGPPVSVGYSPFLIGKNEILADLCLTAPEVSRLHAKIEETENGYLVTDLNSTNGTFVDGRLLEANETCLLNPGSELAIASIRFRFQ